MQEQKKWQSLYARVVEKKGTTKDYFVYFYSFVIPELPIELGNEIVNFPEITAYYCVYGEKGKMRDTHKSLRPDGSYFNSVDEIKDTFRRYMQEHSPESAVTFEQTGGYHGCK